MGNGESLRNRINTRENRCKNEIAKSNSHNKYRIWEKSEILGTDLGNGPRVNEQACIDVCSSLRYGYALSWEGSMYSLRGLMPRTTGRFTKFGLKVNCLRYKNENYAERYLKGGIVTIAYNPDDVNAVWLLENGKYIRFELIEGRFHGKCLTEVPAIQDGQKQEVKDD